MMHWLLHSLRKIFIQGRLIRTYMVCLSAKRPDMTVAIKHGILKIQKQIENKKDRWDSGKPRRQQTTSCDVQIKVAIVNFWHIYVYHSGSYHWNLDDLDFDLARSLKVKSNCAVGLTICDFLLRYKSNYMSISHRLGNLKSWNLSDLDFDLSRSLKVKSDDVIRLAI